MRAQSQALLSLASGGLGGFLGTLLVGYLHRILVLAEGAPGWPAYWWVLTALCVASTVIFGFGYRGLSGGGTAPGEDRQSPGAA